MRHTGFERIQVLGALRIKRDLDNGGQAGPDLFRIHNGDLFRNDAFVYQAAHPAQACGCGGVDPLRQVLVRQGAIDLQLIQYAQI